MKKTYIIPAVESVGYVEEDGILLSLSNTTPAAADGEVLTKEDNSWDIWGSAE